MLTIADHGTVGRDDLRIRPLIEFPALRRAMGLDTEPATGPSPAQSGGLPIRRRGTHRTPGMVQAAPSGSAAASVGSQRVATTAGRRFDRRALLESAV